MPFRLPRLPAPASRLVALALLAVVAGRAEAQSRPRPGSLPGTAPAGRGAPAPRARGQTPPPPPAVPDSARPLAVRGQVWDSVAAAPMGGATIQLAPMGDQSTVLTATADSAGLYRIERVRPGRYVAGFFHPSLDLLGVEPPAVLVDILPDTAVQLDLATPGPTRVRQAQCGTSSAERAMMLGAVRDADTGEPIAKAKVVLTWSELRVDEGGIRNVRRRVPAMTRIDGGYVVCNLPVDGTVIASAEAPGRVGGLIELQLDTGAVVRRDFVLGDSVAAARAVLPDTAPAQEGRLSQPITVARGTARLVGTVRTVDGRPLPGAKLLVWGSDVTGQTTQNGSFALGQLPAGTFSLEVRALGYAPKRIPVDLSSRRPTQVAVVLDNRVNLIEGVTVTADRTRQNRDLTGFEERKAKGGFGRYLSEEDIQKRSALVMTDALRTIPGLQVVPNGGFGYSLRGRGGNCAPDVFVDGMRVMDGATDLDAIVRPPEVAGIEVYNGGAGAPAQYQAPGGGACGTVLIWTKRGGAKRR